MSKKNASYYDKKEIFEKECRPLLSELVSKCHLYNLPFFFSCCVANDENGSEYVNEISSAAGRGLTLTKDSIADYTCVVLGFSVVREEDMVMEIPAAPEDLDMEDEILFDSFD